METAPRDMSLNDSFHKATQKSLGKYFGMYAVGAGIMGGFSAIKENFYPDRKSENLVQDYDSWFENQAEMFGSNDAFLQSIKGSTNIEGMQEEGSLQISERDLQTLVLLMQVLNILTKF